ncbi:glycosyltransferase family 2 protein, partial [Pseudomonas viridiflava]|uniref:glycosyltransferase family 2 protein n=1 Tax=Pseudomonas viridiflava TaxID=33069 RepID=UPI003C6E22FD
MLVDNGSDDPQSLHYFELLSQLKGVTVIRDDGEFNYSAINNNAVEQANGELVGLINNDIEVISPE